MLNLKEGKEDDHDIRMKHNITKEKFLFDSGATLHTRYSKDDKS